MKWPTVRLALPGEKKKRADGSISIDQWLSMFNFDGSDYPILNQTLPGMGQAEIQPTMIGVTDGALKSNSIVYTCVGRHMKVFSDMQFQFQPLGSYAPGDLYGKPSLGLLENPWPGATSRDLLSLMDLYEQVAGNAFVWREDAKTLRVARPDWVTIVLGSRREDGKVGDIDTEVIGYAYRNNGGGDIRVLLPEHVAHWFSMPDPACPYRGISWLNPVLTEISADNAATLHKKMFFENGATANTVVTMDSNLDPDEFEEWVELFEGDHKGVLNAYKRLYLAGGADAKVIGADMVQMDFTNTQGHGEARICNAAGMPPVIAGVVKGLDSATYSNYGQAKEVWADTELRPDWAAACEKLQKLVETPSDSRLWYDERRIAFLKADRKILAETQETQARALRSLIDAGFEPDTAVRYLSSGDLGDLRHTGMYSVQLQPPGTEFKQRTAPGDKTSASHGLALECTLCHEQAGDNHACPRCRRLAQDLRQDYDETLLTIALNFGIDDPDDLFVRAPEGERYGLAAPGPPDPTMFGLIPGPSSYGLGVDSPRPAQLLLPRGD